MKKTPHYGLLLYILGTMFLSSCSEQEERTNIVIDDRVEFPGAFPGGNFLENNGVLFAAEGEGLFTIAISFKSGTNLIRQNVYNHIHKIGPMAPDGSYYEIELRDYDGIATLEKRDALVDIINNSDEWPVQQVIDAKELLKVYDNKSFDKIDKHIRLCFSEIRGGELIASIESLSDSTEIFLEFGSSWMGKADWKLIDNQSIIGKTHGLSDTSITSFLLLKTDKPALQSAIYLNEDEMIQGMKGEDAKEGASNGFLKYVLHKGESICFVAKTSLDESMKKLKLDDKKIKAELIHKRENITKTELHGVGELGAAAQNIRSAVTLLINYNMGEGRRYVNLGYGGKRRQIHPGWDPAFDALTASFVESDLALEHQVSFLTGRMNREPSFHQRNWGAVHANSVWSLYQKFGNRELLEFAFPILKEYYNHLKTMDVNRDGLLELFYNPGKWMGVDDGPMYDNVQQIGNLSDLSGIDINFYYALTAERLAQISEELGMEADAKIYLGDFEQIKKTINKWLWHEELGIYLSRFIDGTWNYTKTPMSFYPLICGIPDRIMAERLINEHLINPVEFWGEYVIPSVSFDDPEFEGKDLYEHFEEGADKSCYEEWRGTIWPPSNYLVYNGMKRYGFDSVAAEFALKSTRMWNRTWEKYNWFPEYFDAIPGRPINDVAANTAHRYQSWSMTLPLTGIQELIDIEPWSKNSGIRFGTLASTIGNNEIHNVFFQGRNYSVVQQPDKLQLFENAKEIVSASTGAVIFRDFYYDDKICSFTIKTVSDIEVVLDYPAVNKLKHIYVPTGEYVVSISKDAVKMETF